jgi:hypothetical protein
MRGFNLFRVWLFAIFSITQSLLFGFAATDQSETPPSLYVESGINHSARSVAFSTDGTLIAGSGIDRTIRVWTVNPTRELLAIENSADIISLAFNPDNRVLLTLDGDGFVKLWDMRDQRLLASQECGEARAPTSATYSADGSKVVCANSRLKTIRQWDVDLGQEYAPQPIRSSMSFEKLTFSRDGRLLAGRDSSGILHIINTATGAEINVVGNGPYRLDTVAFDPKTDRLAAIDSTGSNSIEIWKRISSRDGIFKDHVVVVTNVHAIDFSSDGRTLAYATESADMVLLDTTTWKEVGRLTSFSNRVERAGFVDPKMIAVQIWYDSVVKWNLEVGVPVYDGKLRDEPDLQHNWQDDGQVSGRAIHLDNLKTSVRLTRDGKEGCRLVFLDKLGGWVAVTPDGRFDTNMDLDQIKGVHWVFSGDPFSPLPIETFMRDYYEPGLLPQLLAGKELPKIRSLASLNRVQPVVVVNSVWQDASTGLAKVTVAVRSHSDPEMKNRKTFTKPYDVRVFRDGQLVGWAPKTSVEWQLEAPPSGRDAEKNTELDLQRWREKTEIKNLGPDGTKELTFLVQVPRRADLKQVTFTAYAFNEDRVKSATASTILTVDKPLKARVGKAYVISVGVNRTENSSAWKLNYAANDARQMSKVVGDKLGGTKQFGEVVRVRLVSDAPGKQEAGEAAATKVHLQAVLDVLAGRREMDEVLKKEIPDIAHVAKAEPEDLVLLSFSSHGYTDDRGVFHIVLWDIGKDTPQDKITPELQGNSLSSDVLSGWLRDVDSGEMTMIVDACHSEATVAAEGFKPGPMGSRGLGQLAYDKGMRILAASKSNEEAMELGGPIKQGLLSYALIEEGLVEGKAAKGGKILMSNWLSYGEQEVPNLYKAGKVKGPKGEQPVAPNGRDIIYLGPDQAPSGYQQPVLFDFAKGQADIVLSAQ